MNPLETTPMAGELAVFPLGQPLFPGGLLHLNIFEPRYLAMTEACLRDNRPFGVSLIQGGFEVGTPAIPAAIGCTARIVDCQQPAPGRYRLVARGETRFKIERRRSDALGLILARVQLIEPPDPLPLPSRHQALARLIEEIVAALGSEANIATPLRLEDSAWVAYRWAELLSVSPERRQRWLEQSDALAALAEIEHTLVEQAQQRPPP